MQPGQKPAHAGPQPGPMSGSTRHQAGQARGKHSLANGKDIWGHLPEELRQEMDNVARRGHAPPRKSSSSLYYLSVSKKSLTEGSEPCALFTFFCVHFRCTGPGDGCADVRLGPGPEGCGACPAAPEPATKAAGGFGDPRRGDVPEGAAELITPETERAIKLGLEWLAKSQNADGSFGKRHLSGNIAVTSLAGLAFMESGSSPDEDRTAPRSTGH